MLKVCINVKSFWEIEIDEGTEDNKE